MTDNLCALCFWSQFIDNEYVCENGHKGNYYFNTAMNIGKMCLKKFGLILD